MFVARKGRVGMLAAGSIVISALGVTGAFADGTPSPDSVVTGHAAWYAQAYEDTATGDYTNPDQSDVAGPQRAPYGPGSHKMTIGQFAVQTELYRTDAYDGANLGDLTRLEYSTFARNTAGGADRQPSYLRLSVDKNGGAFVSGDLDSLFFFPANNPQQQSVVNGQWQNWDVENGNMDLNGDNGGDTSLADYLNSHPSATLVNQDLNDGQDHGSLALISGDGASMTNGEYFVDRVIVGQNDQDTLFDFGPSNETDGGTTALTVDPEHSQGWQHQAYDDNFYLDSDQQFVNGPGTPPAGDGSLKMSLSTADNAGRVELFRTEQYDGTLVRDLRTLTYSTYTHANAGNDNAQQPIYLRLSVDTDGDGATDDSLFFYPANNGTPTEDTWQNWDAGTGVWGVNGDDGPQSVTLKQYTVAHPDARIVKNEDSSDLSQVDGGVAFIAGGAGDPQMNGQYYLDAIDISKVDAGTGSVDSGKFFDLEPTPPAPPAPVAIEAILTGVDNGAAADRLKVDAPSEAAGAAVTLYRVVDGVREAVSTSTLNSLGNRRFKVADLNGNHRTKYVAVVSPTDATLGDTTNRVRVR